MTAESDRCLELPLSRRLSGSHCDRTEPTRVMDGWRRGSRFVLERGSMESCDFPGPSITDGGPEVWVMSRKE